MKLTRMGSRVVLSTALLSAWPASTQNSSSEIAPDATSKPVAYVYVQTPKGVNLYNASAGGQITLVSGSPFKISGSMIGSNEKYFITLSTNTIHAYAIGANGAVQQQVSTINTQAYPGGKCGSTTGARLDHSGQYVYVALWNEVAHSAGACSALQSFAIAKGSGKLSFLNLGDNNDDSSYDAPTINSLDTYGYAVSFPSGAESIPYFEGFKRAPDGGLDLSKISVTDPTAKPDVGSYYPWLVDATPNNFLVATVYTQFELESQGPYQLASYKIDGHGNLTSTNTWKNMPAPGICPTSLDMSPAGNLLAVAGDLNDCWLSQSGSTGLQLFHFNGASPITSYGKPITTTSIDQIHWDTSNHLYALSHSTNKLYVYTVTPTKVSPVSGSPYTIPGLSGLLVIPQK